MAIFTELQQVLLNFAINAEQSIVHADPPRRQIEIRTGDRDGWAWIELEDSGPGVPPEHEVKLFQPFYTTKPVGEGTGLGLVGELRHHPIAQRPHRVSPCPIGRRDFLFRASDRDAQPA